MSRLYQNHGRFARLSEARSQKGLLTIVRSQKKDPMQPWNSFLLLASGFWLLQYLTKNATFPGNISIARATIPIASHGTAVAFRNDP